MILAAGRGKRLAPLTDTVPKPLLPVGDQTLIERHLSALSRAGIGDVVVNVSHLAHLIERQIGSGAAYGLKIEYSREPDGPLDTGGGVMRALSLLEHAPFLVVNADVCTDYDFDDIPGRSVGLAHLVLVPNPLHHPAGDFDLDGPRVIRGERNPYTYAGIGVFTAAFFAGVTTERFPLAPLLFDRVRQGSVSGEVYRGAWIDVGSPERLEEARRRFGGTGE